MTDEQIYVHSDSFMQQFPNHPALLGLARPPCALRQDWNARPFPMNLKAIVRIRCTSILCVSDVRVYAVRAFSTLQDPPLLLRWREKRMPFQSLLDAQVKQRAANNLLALRQ